MSKTRQIAKNLSKILHDDVITLKDNTVLISKNQTMLNTNIEGDYVSGGNTSIIAGTTFEFKNQYIGKTLTDSSINKYNYILLTPALANTFIIDGEFIIKGEEDLRSFKITANIGVQKTVLADLQNQNDNEFVAYVQYQGTTWVAIQIVANKNEDILFSGFVSLSNNSNPLSLTYTDFISDLCPILSNNVGNVMDVGWESFDLENLRSHFMMLGACTLDDGNIFYLEMKSYTSDSTLGNDTSIGNGFGSTKNINRAWIINPYTGQRRETSKFPWYPVRGAGCTVIDGGDILVFFGNSYIANTTIPAPNPLPANYENSAVNGFMGYNRYVYRYSPKTEMWSIETTAPNIYGWEGSHIDVTEDRKQVILMGGMLGANYSPSNALVETVKPFLKYPYMYDTIAKKWIQAGKDVSYYKLKPSVNNFITPLAHLSGNLYLVHTFDYLSWTNNGTTDVSTVVANNPQLFIWDCKSYKFTATTDIVGKAGSGICPVPTLAPILKKIDDNKIAIIGGYKVGTDILSSEYTTSNNATLHTQLMTIYDYTTNSFSPAIAAPSGIGYTPSSKLLDGRIALFQSQLTPLYNTTNSAFTYYNTTGSRVFMYDDDKKNIYLSNNWNLEATIPSNITTVIDSTSDLVTVTPAPSKVEYHPYSLAVTPNTGKILFGGFYYYNTANSSAILSGRWYIYDTVAKSLTRVADAPLKGGNTALVALDDDTFILMGGYTGTPPHPSVIPGYSNFNRRAFKFKLSTNTWTEMNTNLDVNGFLPVDGGAVLLPNGKILCGLSSIAPYSISNKAFLYNPVSDVVETIPDCPLTLKSYIWHLNEDKTRVYVFNMHSNSSVRNLIYFDIISNQWVVTNITFDDAYMACSATTEKNKVLLVNSKFISYKFDLTTGECITIGEAHQKAPTYSNLLRMDPPLGVSYKGTLYLYSSFLSNSNSFESYFLKNKI
jgi:hypothetical protein